MSFPAPIGRLSKWAYASPPMHRKRPKNAPPRAEITRETSRDGKIVFVMQTLILVMVPVLIWSQCIPRTIEPASPSSPMLAPVTKEAKEQKSTRNLKGTLGIGGFPNIEKSTTKAPKLCVIQFLLSNICRLFRKGLESIPFLLIWLIVFGRHANKKLL